nr:kinase [Staphylococcus xylosus]
MTVHLIIIRGNSGSGKSTIAKRIQQHLGEGVMLIGQDEVRRQMLNVHDRPGNLAIQLIKEIVDYGINHCDYVILEGILNRHKYGTMLNEFFKKSNANVHVYYFDLSFQETVRRHYTKQQTDFDETAMSKWFVPADMLNVQGEKYITESMTEDYIINMIFKDIGVL